MSPVLSVTSIVNISKVTISIVIVSILANIKLGRKGLPRKNTLAYYERSSKPVKIIQHGP
jgi:hypothetical protein